MFLWLSFFRWFSFVFESVSCFCSLVFFGFSVVVLWFSCFFWLSSVFLLLFIGVHCWPWQTLKKTKNKIDKEMKACMNK